MNELSNNNVLLSDLWGEIATELEDKLLNYKDNNSRVLLIQNSLQALLRKPPANMSAYDYCLGQIQSFKGQIQVKRLSKEINVTHRQLSRQFNNFLGLSPKEYPRIQRFHGSIENIKKHPADSLSQIAYLSGYYDQAHFINEFKEFTGMTPKKYKLSMSNLYNLRLF